MPLGCVQGLKNPQIKRHLTEARADGVAVVLTVDNENDAQKILGEWLKLGLVERQFDADTLTAADQYVIGAMLWDPCFEDANFQMSELLDAWADAINEANPDAVVDQQMLTNAIADVPDYQSGNTNIKAIELVAKLHKLPFEKPRIAFALAEKFWDSDKPFAVLMRKIAELSAQARGRGTPLVLPSRIRRPRPQVRRAHKLTNLPVTFAIKDSRTCCAHSLTQ